MFLVSTEEDKETLQLLVSHKKRGTDRISLLSLQIPSNAYQPASISDIVSIDTNDYNYITGSFGFSYQTRTFFYVDSKDSVRAAALPQSEKVCFSFFYICF